MEYGKLGRTGLKVSRLCLGTMNFGWSADEAMSFAIMDRAVEAGINFIDTADIYSRWIEGNQGGESEAIIGRWLRDRGRRDVVIATKGRGEMWRGPNGQGLSRAHLIVAVEDSLRRLQTDYIDLYQMHWPDHETPLEETISALDALVKAGKIRYVGVSNYPAWLLVKALWVSDLRNLVCFECVQPHYSLLHRAEFERELMPLCRDQGIGVIPYSPLAAGFLTGKYSRETVAADTTRASSSLIQRLTQNEAAYVVLDHVRAMAAARNVPVGQVALGWMLANPVISAPIIGARTVAQLEAMIGAVEVCLTADEVNQLNQISAGF